MKRCLLALIASSLLIATATAAEPTQPVQPGEPDNSRRPTDDADLKYWLENMVWHHNFTTAEVSAATGMSAAEVTAAQKRFKIGPDTKPRRKADAPLLVLPYPGGRHPRIGFLEGAIRPQRETKVSIFTPWDEKAYVVLDVPEAIWWNVEKGRELLYLAHTHIETTWDKKGVTLKKQEWQRADDGTLEMERRLPNNVVFGTRLKPGKDALLMEMWLTNGSQNTLSGLRVQNCIMLKGAPDMAGLSNDNKVFKTPFAACRSGQSDRWLITAWEPCRVAWGNTKCPCMHSDPEFPECQPGKTSRLKGWLSFYQGTNLDGEIERIKKVWQP
jgi:hypothetical protein